MLLIVLFIIVIIVEMIIIFVLVYEFLLAVLKVSMNEFLLGNKNGEDFKIQSSNSQQDDLCNKERITTIDNSKPFQSSHSYWSIRLRECARNSGILIQSFIYFYSPE